VGIPYGPIAVDTERAAVIEQFDADGNRTVTLAPDIRVSYEVLDFGDPEAFLDRHVLRTAREDGFRSRTAQRELSRAVGQLADQT
jgi:hypothetical protein